MSGSRLGLAAASALVVLVVVGATTVARANTVGGNIPAASFGISYSSDPEIFSCPNTQGVADKALCMYTSHDIGSGATTSAPYPMDKTYLYRLNDNADASKPANWVPTQVLDETANVCGMGRSQCGANHLWAPGGRYYNGEYRLYVPDITDVTQQHTSSIIMAYNNTSTLGTSAYTFLGTMQGMPTKPNGGYASDPFWFVDPNTGTQYLVWANGDNQNCGGLSMGRLVNSTTVANGSGQIAILNWSLVHDNLYSSCSSTITRPYMEGPALYLSSAIGAPAGSLTYTLIFAAKPNGSVPTGCSTKNEVIAYAQSNTVTGPYFYEGIIMCGSEGTDGGEWTNQASIAHHVANSKILIMWHDGPHANASQGTSPQRSIHLMCIKWGSDGKIVRVPRSTSNMSNC